MGTLRAIVLEPEADVAEFGPVPIEASPILVEIADRNVGRVRIACYSGARLDGNEEFIASHDHDRIGKLRDGHPAMHNAAQDEKWIPILLDLQQGDEDRRAENDDERIGKRSVRHRLVDRLVQFGG
jgi:hypothetical protein